MPCAFGIQRLPRVQWLGLMCYDAAGACVSCEMFGKPTIFLGNSPQMCVLRTFLQNRVSQGIRLDFRSLRVIEALLLMEGLYKDGLICSYTEWDERT